MQLNPPHSTGNKWKCEHAAGAVMQVLARWAEVAFSVNVHHAPPVRPQLLPAGTHECPKHDEWY